MGSVATVEATQDSPYLQASLEPTAALLKVGHVLVIAPAAIDEEDANLGKMVSGGAEDAD